MLRKEPGSNFGIEQGLHDVKSTLSRASSANGEEFVDQVRDYQRLKDDATPLTQFQTTWIFKV
jgi:hypothetical protein